MGGLTEVERGLVELVFKLKRRTIEKAVEAELEGEPVAAHKRIINDHIDDQRHFCRGVLAGVEFSKRARAISDELMDQAQAEPELYDELWGWLRESFAVGSDRGEEIDAIADDFRPDGYEHNPPWKR